MDHRRGRKHGGTEVTTYAWAAGYIDDGDRPKVVTSRFHLEDSYTLDRYLAACRAMFQFGNVGS